MSETYGELRPEGRLLPARVQRLPPRGLPPPELPGSLIALASGCLLSFSTAFNSWRVGSPVSLGRCPAVSHARAARAVVV